MSIGTFGSFTQARLAIYAAQTGLTVTGNNISNINTPGYTRQRVNQASLHTAGSDRYYSKGDIRVGQGVLVQSISQIRSPYLDIRFRKENASVGYMDAKLDGLNRIAEILDEVGKGDASKDEEGFGVLGLEFSDLYDALSQLTTNTGHQEYDNTVKKVAQSLCAKFRSYAAQLQQTYEETVDEFEENVKKVNGLLDNIRSLNEEIRKCDIHGDNALELRDERNVKIDELSKLVNIQVDYSMEEFSYGVEIEKLSIRLGNSNPDGSVETDSSLLIDGIYGANLILEQVPQPRDAKELAALQAADTEKADKTIWPYIDANGDFTAEKETNGAENTPNPDYEQYLKADGAPTAKGDEARQVNSPNFNLTISELRSKADRLWYEVSKDPEVMVDDTNAAELQAALDAFANGQNGTVVDRLDNRDIITTTYRKSLARNPGNLPYLDANNQPTSMRTDTPNPAYYAYTKTVDGKTVYTNIKGDDTTDNPQFGGRYLDANGKATNDPAQAKVVYYKTVITQTASKPVALDDNDLYGELQAQRELLTEAGEFTDLGVITKESDMHEGAYRNSDENASSKRGIPYYQKSLDMLANKFAEVMNAANQGYRTDPDGNYIRAVVDQDGKPVLSEKTGKPLAEPISFDYTDPADGKNKTFYLNRDTDFSKIPPEVTAQMNGATSVEEYLKQPQLDGKGQPIKDADGQEISNGIFDGGVLFSNNNSGNDTTDITASNIDISYLWSNTNNLVVRDFTCPYDEAEPASGKSDNINHLKYLLDTQQYDYIPNKVPGAETSSGDIMFNGTFFEMWNSIGSTLGSDQEHTGDLLTVHYENALSTDTNRDSVSAVDFNDEAMNLMMYAKSYNAACRLMTTIDSVLDKLVNNTGLTT